MRRFLTLSRIAFIFLMSLPLLSNSSPKSYIVSALTQSSFSSKVDELLIIEDPAPQLSPEGRIPLLMVHGWSFDDKPAAPGTGYWDYHLNYILNDPELCKYFKPYYVKYWSNAVSVKELGSLLRDKVQLAGLHEKPFILLAHSMGGLVSRSFMTEQTFTTGKFAGESCGNLVKLIITLGTPHHGSPMANGPARDDKVSLMLKLYMTAIESIVFNETKYNEINRSDLRWDNYDNLLDYTKYPDEKNDWLTNMNTHFEFDNKLVCYAATVTGEFLLPPYNTVEGQYKVGSYIMNQSFNLVNDGIVPYTSSTFDGHIPKKIRFFDEYNHADIAKGKDDENSLFISVKEDLLELLPPKLLWPIDTGIYLKYSTSKEIKWEVPSSVSSINLYFSGDNGNTFTKIADKINANLGTYSWSIPDTNLTQCIIRITKAADETIYTQSEYPFTIYHNRLIYNSPVAGTYFAPDITNLVSWNQTGIGNTVKIIYSDPVHDIEKVLEEGYMVSQSLFNSFNWIPDHSLIPTDSAYIIIKITGMEVIGDHENYTFISPSFRMLGLPEITVITPSDSTMDVDGIRGGKLEIGTDYTIRWQTEGAIKFVKISLCDSSKNIIQLIRKKNHSPGIHAISSTSWKVPELFGNYFYLLMEAGVSENELTAINYSPFTFRINRHVEITYPDDKSSNVALSPCFSADTLLAATNYIFKIIDTSTNGAEYTKTLTSASPEVCMTSSLTDELLAGKGYQLTAWAMFDTIKSYVTQLYFKTTDDIPGSFIAVAPLSGDTLWEDIVTFSWNHSVGATSYLFELTYHDQLISTKTLDRNDTTLTLNMYKNGYADTLFWKVTAKNDFGETSSSGFFFNKDLVGITTLNRNYASFRLTCYPNPIKRHAVLEFNLPEKEDYQFVSLSIYNLTRQKILTLLNETLKSGIHKIEWDTSTGIFEKGIYIIILDVDGVEEVAKINVK